MCLWVAGANGVNCSRPSPRAVCVVTVSPIAIARSRCSFASSMSAMEKVASLVTALDLSLPVDERVGLIAPLLRKACDEFLDGSVKDGISTYQERLLKRIEDSGLCDFRWVQVDKVGVHPDNRDKAGLVPIDVHDLLLRIFQNGWSWSVVDALACEIPPNEVGAKWREYNADLVEASDGLLAAVNPDDLEVLTGRGSHTTAMVRLYKLGARGIHPELCIDGKISQAKIFEHQPSMGEPVRKGIRYLVIRWQLVLAAPALMLVLSRTGNANHGIHRVTTVLQSCKRVHDLYCSQVRAGQPTDWEKIIKVASYGMPPEYAQDAIMFCDFVQKWSGGAEGKILSELEAYERVLQVKRKIAASDLKALASVDLIDAPRYVPTLVKALLNAPQSMVNDGVAHVFSPQDFHSLSPSGKNRHHAVDAHSMMNSASTFARAYSRLSEPEIVKLTSELEIRAVMHVHGKKTDTRASYPSLLHIAKHFYDDLKSKDPRVPAWPLLAALDCDARKGPSSSGAVREVSLSGDISESALSDRGFKVGEAVVSKSGEEYIIVAVGDVVKLKDVRENDAEVSRLELVSKWSIKARVEEEASRASVS